jgi:hypothetical protein
MESATERSERKRQREKQRRSDLASAFDMLASVLLQIEPGAEEKGIVRAGRQVHLNDTSEADHSEQGGQNITRLDLISETVDAIRRLHAENGKLKNALKARGGQAAVEEALQVRLSSSALNFCFIYASSKAATTHFLAVFDIIFITDRRIRCRL